MDLQAALQSQYHAALKMLREAIVKCPEELWDDLAEGVPIWRVAYHALFFTHFYLQKDFRKFAAWAQHREDAQFLSHVPASAEPPRPCTAFTRDEVLAYWKICDEMIDESVNALHLAASESGFPWYPMSKLEHQIVNIRHIQHHAGALAHRLRRSAGVEISWIGGDE